MKISGLSRNSRGKGYLLLLAVLLIGLLRLAYFYNYSTHLPYLQSPIVDAQVYDEWAQRLAGGQWIGNSAFYRAPLYPYLLGIIYSLAGTETGRVLTVIFQLILGVAGIMMLYRIGCRLLNQRAAIAGAVFFSFCGPLVFYETKLLPTSLGIFLQILTLLAYIRAFDRNRRGDLFIAGAIAGLYALARPNALLLLGLLLFIGGWRELRRHGVMTAMRWLWMPVGCLLVLAPVTLHNYIVSKDIVLISSNAGITFYQGNNEDNHSGLMVAPRRLHSFANAQQQEALEDYVTRRETGRSLKASARSRYWLRQGFQFWFENPAQAIKLVCLKGIKALGAYEYPNNYSFQIERGNVWTLRIFLVPFTLILVLGVLGFLWLPRRHTARSILPAVVVVGLLTNLIFFVTSRYRLEMIPALSLLAGWGCVESVRRIRKWRIGWKEVVFAILLLAVFLIPPDAGRRSQESIMWLHLGVIYRGENRLPEAEKALRTAISVQSANVQARSQLAMVLAADGRIDEAGRVLEPAFASGSPHPVALWAAGVLRVATGDTLGAAAALREAVRRAPRLEPAHLELARLHTSTGQISDAILQLDRAIEMGAASGKIGPMLGELLLQTGQIARAESLTVVLLKEHPHNAVLHRVLLRVLLTAGLEEKVRSYWGFPGIPADWPQKRADHLLEVLLSDGDCLQGVESLTDVERELYKELYPLAKITGSRH